MEKELYIKEVRPGVWLMDEAHEATGYLVVGRERACVIDTMNGVVDLRKAVRDITDKPLIVVNTHGHPDHIYGNVYFREAYLHPADGALARQFAEDPEFLAVCREKGLSMPPFRDILPGEEIDLGGRTLEIHALPGHTPGGILLLLREDRILFTGDSVNHHLWMQLDGCLPLRAFAKELDRVMFLQDRADILLHGHARDADDISLLRCLKNGVEEICDGKTERDLPYQWFGGVDLQHPFACDPDRQYQQEDHVICYRADNILRPARGPPRRRTPVIESDRLEATEKRDGTRMKKTYITTMPNHIGAFLKASECFAALGVNITRVSYNKAVDSHTLFIDAEGDEAQLRTADEQLARIGYLQTEESNKGIVLLEFHLKDVPGSVTRVLRLISEYRLNISYISSQENGTEYQAFKMGLFVEDEGILKAFLSRVEALCPVRVIDYNHAEKVYDNSIFYRSFVSGLMQTLELPEACRDALLVNSNLVMQMLDEKGLSPYKTFESISRFAELLSVCRGGAFSPRITRHRLAENTEAILIEPPCGSNTAILQSGGETLFIDSGYALYREEMVAIFRRLLPDWDSMRKRILITHADVDHCGLLPLFDEILASAKSRECLALEHAGEYGFREQNPMHRPYISICKAMTGYAPPDPGKVAGLWDAEGDQEAPLVQTGLFRFGEMVFEVYQGKGGHLAGETVLIDFEHHVAFTGDIYVNVHGMTREQSAYNQYAPVLMTSVDTDPALCAAERRAILQRLGVGQWQIFGAHGMKKDYQVQAEK